MLSFILCGFSLFTLLGILYVFWGFTVAFFLSRNGENNLSFECGFLPFSVSRIPFSLRFFFLLILFVIFDLEISLFLQLPFQVCDFFLKNRSMFLFFFLFLSFCLLEEWRRGVVYWA